MKITMLQTRRVSEDGHTTRKLVKGETYDIAHTAACHALNNGWAFNAEPSTGDKIMDAMLDAFDRIVAKTPKSRGEHFIEALNQSSKAAL